MQSHLSHWMAFDFALYHDSIQKFFGLNKGRPEGQSGTLEVGKMYRQPTSNCPF